MEAIIQTQQDNGIKRIEKLNDSPYYIVKFGDNSEKVMSIEEVAEITAKMNKEVINPIQLCRQFDLLEKSPSISDWLTLEARIEARQQN